MRSSVPRRTGTAERPGVRRLAILASGDFACNLYWQSVSLFLLFFYTDVLRLAPAIAGSLYMIGALWDGLADLTVGIVLQRRAVGRGGRIATGHTVASGGGACASR